MDDERNYKTKGGSMKMNFLDNVPAEWQRYVTQTPIPLECVDGLLWDTERFAGGEMIRFFQRLKNRADCNLWYPGRLPNPQSFLIQRIKFRGLTRRIAHGGTAMLVIGNKIYFEAPLDQFLRTEKFIDLDNSLMIAPQQNFFFELRWDQQKIMAYAYRPKIKITFRGQLVRAVQ